MYMVMDFCPGGDLFFHLSQARRFTQTRTKFYAAEVLSALDYIHQMGIIYRYHLNFFYQNTEMGDSEKKIL